jgi:hypothetical protein
VLHLRYIDLKISLQGCILQLQRDALSHQFISWPEVCIYNASAPKQTKSKRCAYSLSVSSNMYCSRFSEHCANGGESTYSPDPGSNRQFIHPELEATHNPCEGELVNLLLVRLRDAHFLPSFTLREVGDVFEFLISRDLECNAPLCSMPIQTLRTLIVTTTTLETFLAVPVHMMSNKPSTFLKIILQTKQEAQHYSTEKLRVRIRR